MSMPTTDNVATKIPETEADQTVRALIDALMGGTMAMRAQGRTFLPQDAKEKDAAYDARLNRSTLFPGYKRTVQYLTGQVFSSQVQVDGDPDGIDLENVTTSGDDLTTFCQEVFRNGVNHGSTLIMTDMPPRDPGTTLTVAEARAAGVRPYLVNIKITDVIGWKVGAGGKLAQLRFREVATVEAGEYAVKQEERIRVLEPGKYAVYRKQDGSDDKWVIAEDADGNPMEGTTSLDFIPVSVFMPGQRRSLLTADPPLEDLAFLNLSHWQSQSDQRNILHVARVPILFGRMLDESSIDVGVSSMINSQDEKGSLEYVEHSGAAIEAGRQDLEDLKTEMAIFGLQLMITKTGNVTATENALNSAESDSTLKSWAILFAKTMATAIDHMARFIGAEFSGEVTVNTDFRNMLQDFTPKELLDAVNDGVLSKEIVFDEFIRRGMITGSVSWAENLAQIENEGRSSNLFAQMAGNAGLGA